MIYLVTGGSGSGKSAYAEEKLCSLGNDNRIYFATMEVSDKEGRKKVERHRKLREGKAFTTIEYLSYLGEINAAIAKQAAEVTEVVYGIPVFAKSIAAERKPME